jgi:beta-lactamase class A
MATRARSRRKKQSGLPVLQILSISMIVAAVVLFIFELIGFSQREDRLASGVLVGGVDVSGLTQRQAEVTWEQAFARPVSLYYGNSPIQLEPSTIDFRVNSATMLANALSGSTGGTEFWLRFLNHLTQQEIGRTGTSVPLLADYQESLLRQFLEDIAARYDRPSGRPAYDVPTLSVVSGTIGSTLDIPAAMDMIDAALRDPNGRAVNLPLIGAETSQPTLQTLRQLIIDYLDSQGFIYDGQTTVASIFVMDLQTGEEISILGDVAFSAASTIKLPIMIDFFRMRNTPPSQDEAWLLANSLLCSQNSSSNLLMQLIGGGQDVFAGIRSVTSTAQNIGMRNTYISARLVEGVANEQFGATTAPATSPNPNFNTQPDPFNQTTAEDMGTAFNLIYDCAEYGSGLMTAYPDGEFTQRECRQMLELMSANDLLRLLQGGIPADERISHKNGWLSTMVGDAGIVYSPNGRNYIISVFLYEATESNFQDFTRLWPLVEGISRAAWNYFNPDEAMLTPRTDLPPTAQECEGNYLPPDPARVNLDDINAWRRTP